MLVLGKSVTKVCSVSGGPRYKGYTHVNRAVATGFTAMPLPAMEQTGTASAQDSRKCPVKILKDGTLKEKDAKKWQSFVVTTHNRFP